MMFVNSGSEANDVAIQIARAVTGNRGAVITEHAYHGTTAATAALSPRSSARRRSSRGWRGSAARRRSASPRRSRRSEARSTTPSHDCRGRRPRAGAPDLRRRLLERRHLRGATRLPSRGLRARPRRGCALPRRRGAGRVRPRRRGVLGLRAGRRRARHRHARKADGERASDGAVDHDPGDRGRVRRALALLLDVRRLTGRRSRRLGRPRRDRARTARRAGRARRRLSPSTSRGVAATHRSSGRFAGPGLFVGVELDCDAARARDIGKAVANGLRRRGVLVGATGPRVNVIKIRPPLVFSESARRPGRGGTRRDARSRDAMIAR